MAHFRGIIKGNRGPASRLATKGSGLLVEAASWEGKVLVELTQVDGKDYAFVALRPHFGNGISQVLYDGPVGGPERGDSVRKEYEKGDREQAA